MENLQVQGIKLPATEQSMGEKEIKRETKK